MKDALLLTLGHGSSAILIKDNKIVNGYQTERITGVKGDSRFPIHAIEMIRKYDDIPEGIPILISHWHPSGDVYSMREKHFDPSYLRNVFPNSKIISTGSFDFTHHDAHAFSALAYATNMPRNTYIIVADGFGNFGEVLSIYKRHGKGLRVQKKVYGYQNSLGLLYQYATDYVGMRPNRDEWKLNALSTFCPVEIRPEIDKLIDDTVESMFASQFQYHVMDRPDDPVINLGALSFTQKDIVNFLDSHFDPESKDSIAYFLQGVVEGVLTKWIHRLEIENLIVVGGCFLNVELNGALRNRISGKFCAMPLSGDEGAALGIFKYLNHKFQIPEDLCFGKRTLTEHVSFTPGILYVRTDEDLQRVVTENLVKNKIVNVVRGNMEFGPRAYCNTSTLAIPTIENKEYINKVNERSPYMPMCPVLGVNLMKLYFHDYSDISRSVEHMIVTLKYKSGTSYADGTKHKMLDGSYSGRPQVIYEDHWLYPITHRFGPLINTSFNNHGRPITFETRQAIECHMFMKERDVRNKVVTIIQLSE